MAQRSHPIGYLWRSGTGDGRRRLDLRQVQAPWTYRDFKQAAMGQRVSCRRHCRKLRDQNQSAANDNRADQSAEAGRLGAMGKQWQTQRTSRAASSGSVSASDCRGWWIGSIRSCWVWWASARSSRRRSVNTPTSVRYRRRWTGRTTGQRLRYATTSPAPEPKSSSSTRTGRCGSISSPTSATATGDYAMASHGLLHARCARRHTPDGSSTAARS